MSERVIPGRFIYVVCPTYSQARLYAERKGFSPMRLRHITDPLQIKGLENIEIQLLRNYTTMRHHEAIIAETAHRHNVICKYDADS